MNVAQHRHAGSRKQESTMLARVNRPGRNGRWPTAVPELSATGGT